MNPLYIYPDKNNDSIIKLEHYHSESINCKIEFDECIVKKLTDKFVFIFGGVSDISNPKLPKNNPDFTPLESQTFYMVINTTKTKGFDFKTQTEKDVEPNIFEKGMAILFDADFYKLDVFGSGQLEIYNNTVLSGLANGSTTIDNVLHDSKMLKKLRENTFSFEPINNTLYLTDTIINQVLTLLGTNTKQNDYTKKYANPLTSKIDAIIEHINKAVPNALIRTLLDIDGDELYNRQDLTDEEKAKIRITFEIIKEVL